MECQKQPIWFMPNFLHCRVFVDRPTQCDSSAVASMCLCEGTWNWSKFDVSLQNVERAEFAFGRTQEKTIN